MPSKRDLSQGLVALFLFSPNKTQVWFKLLVFDHTCMLAYTDKIFSLLLIYTDEFYILLFPEWPRWLLLSTHNSVEILSTPESTLPFFG